VRSWLYFQKNDHCVCGYLPGWSSSVFWYNPVLPNRLEIDSELCNYVLFTPVMYGVFGNSWNHNLNGQQLQTHRTDTSELCNYVLFTPVMYGVFGNSCNHSLNGQQLQTHRTDTSELRNYVLFTPVMYGVLYNSWNHSLNGQQFQTHGTDTITSPPKFGPNQLLKLPKFCLPLFTSFLEDRNFGVNSNKTFVDLLVFKCKK